MRFTENSFAGVPAGGRLTQWFAGGASVAELPRSMLRHYKNSVGAKTWREQKKPTVLWTVGFFVHVPDRPGKSSRS
jgi:hypothetical protein